MFGYGNQRKKDNEMYKKYHIGKTFYYLGIKMTIAKNWDIIPGIGKIPYIYAHYVNKHGEICCKEFQPYQLEELL